MGKQPSNRQSIQRELCCRLRRGPITTVGHFVIPQCQSDLLIGRSNLAEDALATGGIAVMPREVNVLALLKGQERYIYVYDDISHPNLLQTVRNHAADPELSLTWFDVTVLTKKAHEQVTATLVGESGLPLD